jgi:hypothetical protein
MPRQRITSVYAGKRYTIYPGDIPVQEYYHSFEDNSDLFWGGVGHYGYPDFPGASDIGGDFGLTYNRVENGAAGIGTIQGGTVFGEYRYDGSIYIQTPNEWVTSAATSADNASGQGATAYSKMKPDKPSMNGLNAIYELKDLPGMLKQRFHAKNLHEIGDYYLAEKFGWGALLSDVCNFVITQRKAQDRLKQLLRDEGRPVKRKITLNDSTAINWEDHGTDTYGTFVGPHFVSYFYAKPGIWRNTLSRVDKTWASARFRYWLPGGPRDIAWTNDMLGKIFGLKPTPATVYRAIPWTWLAEWFTNVGDMIDNLETSLVDRLAADYFYCMRKVEDVYEFTHTPFFFRVNTLEHVSVTVSGRRTRGVKTRLRGDPFGWGTNPNALNGTQLSILGALGLSRLR